MGPPICMGRGYPKFWTCVFKLHLLPTMWSIFVEFCSATSEIRRRKKKKERRKNPWQNLSPPTYLQVYPNYNLGRGPRHGVVTHRRRKVRAIGYNGAPQKYLFLWTDLQTALYLPHSWTRPAYDAKRHPDPIRRFATMYWTARPTQARTRVRRPTDRPRESLTTIGRWVKRVTRPNNNSALTLLD